MAKNKNKLIALLMSAAMLFSSLQVSAQEEDKLVSNEDQSAVSQENRIHFDDIKYKRPDFDKITKGMDKLMNVLERAETYEEIVEAYEQYDEAFGDFNTMYTYAQLQTSLDVTNAFYQQELQAMSALVFSLTEKESVFTEAMMTGPFAEQYENDSHPFFYEKAKQTIKLYAEGTETLWQKISMAPLQYQQLRNQPLSATYNGREYDETNVADVFPTQSTRTNAAYYLYQKNAPQFAAILEDMVKTSWELADINGFDNPADMYYVRMGRDYTPAQTKRLCKYIEENFVPLMQYSADMSALYQPVPSQKKTLKEVASILKEMDPALKTVWDDMRQYGMYDIEPSATKAVGAFTASLPAFNSAFLFMSWTNDVNSLRTLFHEFGHFYNFTVNPGYESRSGNIDMEEIFSTALELLSADYYGNLTAQQQSVAYTMVLSVFVNTLVYQAMLEEFQLVVYSWKDGFTANDLARLYAKLMDDYGIIPGANVKYGHTWFEIPHFFNSPFYTISYTVSSYPVLELYLDSREDREGTIDKLLDMMHSDQRTEFLRFLKQHELSNPMKEATTKEMAVKLEETFIKMLQDMQAGTQAAA